MQFQLGQLLQDVKMATTAIARDIRSGQIKMLVISTSLGVAALSSVGFLSNRLESGLERDARQMQEFELEKLQERIQFNVARNDKTARHLNIVRVLICASPLIFLATIAFFWVLSVMFGAAWF